MNLVGVLHFSREPEFHSHLHMRKNVQCCLIPRASQMAERSLDSFAGQDVQFLSAWLLLSFNRILRMHLLIAKLSNILSL